MILLLSNIYKTKDIAGKIDKRYLKIEGISTLNERLHMSQYRISDLADPVEYGDAVTKRYVVARVQGLTDIIGEMQPQEYCKGI